MIILAHDGSIYSDWVARYALHFAATEKDRKLLVLHVQDGEVPPDIVDARFEQLAGECDVFNVEFIPQSLPLGSSVHRTLRQAVPHDPESLLICGTRVKPRRQRYLTGTISEKLLRMHLCPVLVMRIVQPGLLGNPHDLLLPLTGYRYGFSAIAPFIQRLAPHLRYVYLCQTVQVNPLRHPHMTSAMERALKQKGFDRLEKIDQEMAEFLGPYAFRCDRLVTIADKWEQEVLMLASRLKAQLMLLGLSERTLAYRVFHSAAIEGVLHKTPCDIGIYRAL
ncbi:MAG: universal stress protein [Desulfuromonadales bacterium]